MCSGYTKFREKPCFIIQFLQGIKNVILHALLIMEISFYIFSLQLFNK